MMRPPFLGSLPTSPVQRLPRRSFRDRLGNELVVNGQEYPWATHRGLCKQPFGRLRVKASLVGTMEA